MTKPVAPEVDLDDAFEKLHAELFTLKGYALLDALIAETRAHRATNQPHIGSCAGCFFAEVELLAALKDGAEAGEPAEKLLSRVLDVLRDEAHRPACAAKLPPVGVVRTWEEAWRRDCPRSHNLLGSAHIKKAQARRLSSERVHYRDGYLAGFESARGAAAKPPAGVEVGEALDALERVWADPGTGQVVLSLADMNTIRSALESSK